MTTIRARIQPDPTTDSIRIHLVHHLDQDGTYATAEVLHGGILDWTIRHGTVGDVLPTTLVLTDDTAHALLDALADHYGGVIGMRTIREDYLHERGRVDQLIQHLIASPR